MHRIVDAVLFLLGIRLNRSGRAHLFKEIRNSDDEAIALAAIAAEFSLRNEPLWIEPKDKKGLHRLLLSLAKRGSPPKQRFPKMISEGFNHIRYCGGYGNTRYHPIPDHRRRLARTLCKQSSVDLIAVCVGTRMGISGAPPLFVGTALTLLELALLTVAVIFGGENCGR